MNAGLFIEDELLREEVDDLAVGLEKDGAGAIDGGAYVFAGDLAEARAQADAAAAVQAADVGTPYRDDALLNGGVGAVFGLGGGLVDGLDGRGQLGDDALAGAGRVHDAMAAVAQGSVIQLGDEEPGLCAS